MAKKKSNLFFKYLLLIILILIIIYYLQEDIIEAEKISEKTTIYKDGFKVWNLNYKNKPNMNTLIKKLKNLSKKELGPDYIFLDYRYHLKGCSVSTFHRDITSNKTTYKTKYPTYTALIYNYAGNYFSVCPNSHKTYPFAFERPLSIVGKGKALVIFDGDLLHAGMINNVGNKRDFMQFKIVHKDDLKKLIDLNKINVKKENICNNSYTLELFLRKLSYLFAFFINFFSSLFVKKEKSGIKKHIQNLFPFLNYYNNN
tara:strand:+ start:4048 stop:4818 length:771 start_codon:yes stop_codon:yes gene_type:complete